MLFIGLGGEFESFFSLKCFLNFRFKRDTGQWLQQSSAKNDKDAEKGRTEIEKPDDNVTGQRRHDVRRHYNDVVNGTVAPRRRRVVAYVAARKICIQSFDATDGAKIPRQERNRREVRMDYIFLFYFPLRLYLPGANVINTF